MRISRKYFKLLIYSLVYWAGVLSLYYIFRYFGLEQETGIMVNEEIFGRTKDWLLVTLFGGLVLGFLYFLVELLTDLPFFKRESFGFVLASKVLLYFIILLFVTNFISKVVSRMFLIDMLDGPIVTYKFFWSFVAYFTIFSSIFSFFGMVSEKFGQGVLVNMLLGKYRTPKEEKRVFMFLDLRSSTTIAEKLGHFEYSRLIQQCFYDLNEIVATYEGEIYQYVGDEAVISWPYDRGIRQNQCIDCFFGFQTRLMEKEEFYRNEFGLVPEFKAGIHGGHLIVTEVGIMKKEIAYHGDVINTTSRIQEACNDYDEKLLISEQLLSDLDKALLKIRELGKIALKGKHKPISILAIHQEG